MSRDTAPSGPRPKSTLRSLLVSGCAVILIVTLAVAMVCFWVYGLDSHHKSRDSIGWGRRIYSLTPPAARDITLQRDFLDHYAMYTVAEKDLNAFLDSYFGSDGRPLNSFAERSKPRADLIGKLVGPFGWVVTESAVVYSYAASNGGVSTYYHEPATGETYQQSAHW